MKRNRRKRVGKEKRKRRAILPNGISFKKKTNGIGLTNLQMWLCEDERKPIPFRVEIQWVWKSKFT
jgi:hypothetical protein